MSQLQSSINKGGDETSEDETKCFESNDQTFQKSQDSVAVETETVVTGTGMTVTAHIPYLIL
eukprot:2487929-Ditylum_brightwellii.AAC.1